MLAISRSKISVFIVVLLAFISGLGIVGWGIRHAAIESTIHQLTSGQTILHDASTLSRIDTAVPTLISRHRQKMTAKMSTLKKLNDRIRLWSALSTAWGITRDDRIRQYYENEIAPNPLRIRDVEYLLMSDWRG